VRRFAPFNQLLKKQLYSTSPRPTTSNFEHGRRSSLAAVSAPKGMPNRTARAVEIFEGTN
jgi:hypothetical protein